MRAAAITLFVFWMLVFFGLLSAYGQTEVPPDPNAPPPGCGAQAPRHKIPMVWTQQPRHQTPIEANVGQPANYGIDDASNEQMVGDIGLYNQQSESDGVYRDALGVVHTLYDCTGSKEICAVESMRVSPNGKRVIFSVNKTPGNTTQWPVKAMNGPWTDVWYFKTTGAELWVCELATKECKAITSGHIDRFPEWASDDTIVFTSDREGVHPARSFNELNFYPDKSQQLYRGRLVGTFLTKIVNLTPDKWFVMSPEVRTNGDVCYSHFEGVWPRDFGSTPQNHWWIECRDINGEAIHSEFGAHGSGYITSNDYIRDILDPATGGENVTAVRGLRGIAEVWTNYLMVGNYYRSNSAGANGTMFGWQSDGDKSEGCLTSRGILGSPSASDVPGTGRFIPCSTKNITPWGLDQDRDTPKFHSVLKKAMGRSGYPFALPGDVGFGYTRSRGYCYRAVPAGLATYDAMGGEPPCKRQIDMTKVTQVLDPFDKAQTVCMAACELDVHGWDGQYAGPYVDLFGIETPAIAEIKAPAEECFLSIIDATSAELFPVGGPDTEKNRTALQGNTTVAPEQFATTIKFFGVEVFEPWRTVPTKSGVFKVTQDIRAPLEADGSVRIKVPCGEPFQHFGYDAGGKKIASALAPLAISGEEVCSGCHDHSTKPGNMTAAQKRAAFKLTIAGKSL